MKQNRRKLIKALTVCGSSAAITKLPGSWSKPVLESVVLPAHAQSTSQTTCSVAGITVAIFLDIGTGSGGGGYDLFDSSQCYYSAGGPGGIDNEWTYPQLGPGTYYFFGTAGYSQPTGAARVSVSCCNASEEAVVDGGDGGDTARLQVMIVISENGACTIEEISELPIGPC